MGPRVIRYLQTTEAEILVNNYLCGAVRSYLW